MPRQPVGPEARTELLAFRLTVKEADELDRQRKAASRSEYLRKLIRDEKGRDTNG